MVVYHITTLIFYKPLMTFLLVFLWGFKGEKFPFVLWDAARQRKRLSKARFQ